MKRMPKRSKIEDEVNVLLESLADQNKAKRRTRFESMTKRQLILALEGVSDAALSKMRRIGDLERVVAKQGNLLSAERQRMSLVVKARARYHSAFRNLADAISDMADGAYESERALIYQLEDLP